LSNRDQPWRPPTHWVPDENLHAMNDADLWY
jgi:hypothetical protein